MSNDDRGNLALEFINWSDDPCPECGYECKIWKDVDGSIWYICGNCDYEKPSTS
jgi:hypothetical protein